MLISQDRIVMSVQSKDITEKDIFLLVASLSQTLEFDDLNEETKLGFGMGNAGFDSITISSLIDLLNIYIAVRRGGERNDIPTGTVGESTTLGKLINLVQARLTVPEE